MKILDRVPFDLAIKGEKLLKPRWDQLSAPQKTVLKAFYGLPLSDEEMVFWSIFQGGATYDTYGYPKSVTMVPYTPKEYSRLVPVLGRRSGKTDYIVSTATAYEITLGGHKQYVREGQEYKCLFLAQTVGDAQKNMAFIKLALEDSPLLSKEIKEAIASEIRLHNGLIVEPAPANKAIGRGHAIPVVILDENAFWYTDPNAANPDYEVLRAVSYSQLQFPNAKQFLPSTPWAEQGILYQSWKAGTQGRNLQCESCKGKNTICEHPLDQREKYTDTLVIHASTMAMQNPLITHKRIVEIHRDDPEAFPRESLAQFIKSVSGWLNYEKVEKAVMTGKYKLTKLPRKNHPEDPTPTYVAAMDPAFRNDAYAFTIVHHDERFGIVQDFVKYWEPKPGQPLKPGKILDEIKGHLDEYGINMVYSDQHQLESLQELALDRNFVINKYDFTALSKGKITGSFKVVVDQERLKILDHDEQKEQLVKLQKQVLQSGNVRIAAPPGKHDDLAMCLILASHICMWLKSEQPEKPKPVQSVEADHVKMGMATIERRRQEARQALEDDW